MKCVFVLLLCVCAIYGKPDAAGLQQKFMGYAGTCKKEIGLPQEDFNKLLQKELPTSEKGKCFLFCLHRKIGVVNEDGTKNTANMENIMAEVKASSPKLAEKVEVIANRCWPEIDESAEPCEGSYKVFTCYLNVAKEVNLSKIE